MALSQLPLGYCTNVHAGRSVAEVLDGLDRYTVPVRNRVAQPIAAGLWLARPVVDELLGMPDGASRLANELSVRQLTCYTLNAFPYGDFHAARVKETVYLPNWADPKRLTYTAACAVVLAGLLPDGVEGSISTLPLAFKDAGQPADVLDMAARQLIDCARLLAKLEDETGRTVRLAIEPEPFCSIETTAEAVGFFERLWATAGRSEDAVRRHIGLCYDICHQAVEFEDVAESVQVLDRAGVRINKVQISCAIQFDRPADNQAGRDALRRYIEPRYLHQTFAKLSNGSLARAVDLTEPLLSSSPPEFASAECWRIHFHVPVDADRLGPLATTRPAAAEALAAIARLDYSPHLETETYTWEVMPGVGPPDLVTGLARELIATHELVAAVRG